MLKKKKWLNFLTSISSKNLLSQNVPTRDKLKKLRSNELQSFDTIFNESDMIHYLENSNSLYHQLCDFFLKHPIHKSFIVQEKFQTHHIFCLFLDKNYYSFLQSLDNNYNLIQVPFFIHALLHFIRNIEFRYKEDNVAAKNMFNKLFFNKEVSTKMEDLIDKISSSSGNLIENSEFLENETKKNQEIQKYRHQKRINKQPEKINTLYANQCVWENLTYSIEPIIIEANTLKENGDLATLLQNKTCEYFEVYPDLSKPPNLTNWANVLNNLNRYLLKNQHKTTGPFAGWVLRKAHPIFKELTALKFKDSPMKWGNETIKITEFLKNDSFWVHEKYNNGKKILIPKGKFKSVHDLEKYLLCLSNGSNLNDPKTDTIQKFMSKVIWNKLKSYQGWKKVS